MLLLGVRPPPPARPSLQAAGSPGAPQACAQSTATLPSPRAARPQTGQAAARRMVQQGTGGAIVNMSSVNGVMAIPTICGYNARKGGVNNLTRRAQARATGT